MPALVVFVGVFAALVGSFGVSRADQVPPGVDPPGVVKPGQNPPDLVPPAPPQGRLTILTTEAGTGRPLDGVAVEYRIRSGRGGNMKQGTPATDRDGFVTIDYDPNAKVGSFTLEIHKAGYVPAYVYWDGSKHPVTIPVTKSFALEKGTTVGGIVNDEAGKPVEGVAVSLMMQATESDMNNFYFYVASTQTDAQGRWRTNDAPANLSRVNVRVAHPRYIEGYGKLAPGVDGVTAVLVRGLTVTGTVVDAGGNPVAGAKAVIGLDIWGSGAPEARTDDRGRYTLERCKPGASLVTIQAEGFAPQFRDVRVEEKGDTRPVDFTLGPPSQIRVRVVDVAGQPVANAGFAADTWAGHRSIMFRATTDADGRVRWNSAPRDTVQYDIYQTGYMRRRQLPLAPSDEEQVVVLYPELTITGRVTDKKTGEPIPKFTIIRGMLFEGSNQISWSRNEPIEFSDGQYTESFDFPVKSWFLRVEAPGHKPTDSRPFRSEEGQQVHDFTLEPAAGFGGVVLAPDGQPAEGINVALATPGTYVALQGSTFNRNYNSALTRTGPDGRFEFPPPDGAYQVLAAGEAGFAAATSAEFAKSGKLTLVPWGKIEGRVMIGTQPGANQPVSFQPDQSRQGYGGMMLSLDTEIQTDAEGRFVFDKVIPGPGNVSRVVITEFPGGSQTHAPCWQTPVEVKPGATVNVTVGGTGRPVVGRVVIVGTPDSPVDWRQNDPATITPARSMNLFGLGKPRMDRFAANLDRDGRFRIDDVPPGRYQVTIPVNTTASGRNAGAGPEIGRAALDFTVPAGDPANPVDLGDIPAKLLPTLKVGDLAPDFSARRLDGTGEPIKLASRRGKFVLIAFWSVGSGNSLVEMPTWKDIQDTFGPDPRFELIGLACDFTPAPAATHARDNGMNWTQGFAGNFNGPIASLYLIRTLPVTVLVGPDGRILAKNLTGDALKDAVRAALKP